MSSVLTQFAGEFNPSRSALAMRNAKRRGGTGGNIERIADGIDIPMLTRMSW
jgi:hypothetical protein